MTDLINLYRQAEDYFFRGISSKCLNLSDTANAYMTGVPTATLNLGYVIKNTNSLDKILNKAKQFYNQYNLSFTIIIPQEFCTSNIKGILNAMSYSQTGESISMALKLGKFTVNYATCFDDETTIRTNDDQLNEWMLPLIGAFESTLDISSLYASTHKSVLEKHTNLHHFSLYIQEKPLTSITLSLHDSIARIDDLSNLPAFQDKGYATRLMTYTLSEARRLGALYCFLESSHSGLEVYKKLKFEVLFKNNIYSSQG